MGLFEEHEIHKRRLVRNLALGVVLGAFVIGAFITTMANLRADGPVEGFDYQPVTNFISTTE